MSTRKTLLGEQQHGDEAAALPPPPEAHPAGAPTESLRQADEPPSEATLSPNPSHPDGPPGTAGALTVYWSLHTFACHHMYVGHPTVT